MKWRRITILQTYILLFAFDAVVYLCVLRFLVSLLYIFLLFSVRFYHIMVNKLCRNRHNYALPPVTFTFDLLTLEVVSESRVTWSTSVPILIFLGLSVLDLGPMYATNRQTSDSIIA